MYYENVPQTIANMQKQNNDSLHAMAQRAGIAYSTIHSWRKGTASPTVDKFNAFLISNGFRMRVLTKV